MQTAPAGFTERRLVCGPAIPLSATAQVTAASVRKLEAISSTAPTLTAPRSRKSEALTPVVSCLDVPP